jgi:hypothetical protein
VRAFLKQLGLALQRGGHDTRTLSGQEIGNALHGLQSLNGGCEEVRNTVKELYVCIKQSNCFTLSHQGVGNSLYGIMQLCNTMPEADIFALFSDIKNDLHRLLDEIVEGRESMDGIWGFHLIRYLRFFQHFVGERQQAFSLAGETDKVQALLTERGYRAVEIDVNNRRNYNEELLYTKVKSQVEDVAKKGYVFRNVYLYGCFESDVIISTRPTSVEELERPAALPLEDDGSPVVFNIEVDGPAHDNASKREWYPRRDDFLQCKSKVRVQRISLWMESSGRFMYGKDMDDAVQTALEELGFGSDPPSVPSSPYRSDPGAPSPAMMDHQVDNVSSSLDDPRGEEVSWSVNR